MIVIPAAGEGSRFREAGYEGPKHLLPLNGVPMIDRVVANVRPLDPSGDVLVVTQELLGFKTRGAVDTIHQVAGRISDGPLVIANCDQLCVLDDFEPKGDGVIFTFPSANPAHSYVSTIEDDQILAIVEKKVVTNRAVSGVYWFADSAPFLAACHRVVEREDGELYVSAALSVMLDHGYKLYAQNAPTAILGTPEDFQRFEVAARCAA